MIQAETIEKIEEIKTNINRLNEQLEEHYRNILIEDANLSRQIVSFQANKRTASFRWYKYKEAFSAVLIEYFINKFGLNNKNILDPFAGVGTTLFASSNLGCKCTGIELLSIGQKIIETRIKAHYGFYNNYIDYLKSILSEKPWLGINSDIKLNELRITKNAYPNETKKSIQSFIKLISTYSNSVKDLLELALLSILEEISFTRKDGQYLRWDYRANRGYGQKIFDKGLIKDFDTAIIKKLNEIILDLNGNDELYLWGFDHRTSEKGEIKLIKGSCLDELPKLNSNTFDAIITSPPYCNRYDYTRTYALELALLGVDEKSLLDLRQTMLSCTVENREKNLLEMNSSWSRAIHVAEQVDLLKTILVYLNEMKKVKRLNNNGIVRMIRGYFFEMSCVIYELHRVLKKGGYVIMVNDNVRYAGVCVPVDLILSRIAENIGFNINNILVLPQKKGNSSQQMSKHGRKELRKCVYVWEKM
ncbi:MAG: DNA methyltransferase [candidate division Zixibacteria bacterium]|nr:DNA methyltransferase [candidate division Zixibacteria bacterium]